MDEKKDDDAKGETEEELKAKLKKVRRKNFEDSRKLKL